MIRIFIKNIIALFLLIFIITSCNNVEPIQSNDDTSSILNEGTFGISINSDVEEFKVNNTRGITYDVDDKGALSVNLLRFRELFDEDGNPKPEWKQKLIDYGYPENITLDKLRVPVTLFFKTSSDPSFTYHKEVLMSIKGAKSLVSPFLSLPEIGKKYTEANKNTWYVKAFLGGVRGHKQNISNNNAYSYQWVVDYLYDVDQDTDFVITQYAAANYDANNPDNIASPYSRLAMPFPMETDWTNVKFFFKANLIDSNNGESPKYTNKDQKNDDYPEHDAPAQNLHFKPIGSLLRLKIINESNKDLSIRHLNISPMGNNPSNSLFANDITRYIDPQSMNGINIADANIDILSQAKTVFNKNGNIHYHSVYGINKDYKDLVIKSGGGYRIFYIWLMEDPAVSNDYNTIPYMHSNDVDETISNFNDFKNNNKNNTYFYLGDPNQGITIRKGELKNGYSYLWTTKINNTKVDDELREEANDELRASDNVSKLKDNPNGLRLSEKYTYNAIRNNDQSGSLEVSGFIDGQNQELEVVGTTIAIKKNTKIVNTTLKLSKSRSIEDSFIGIGDGKTMDIEGGGIVIKGSKLVLENVGFPYLPVIGLEKSSELVLKSGVTFNANKKDARIDLGDDTKLKIESNVKNLVLDLSKAKQNVDLGFSGVKDIRMLGFSQVQGLNINLQNRSKLSIKEVSNINKLHLRDGSEITFNISGSIDELYLYDDTSNIYINSSFEDYVYSLNIKKVYLNGNLIRTNLILDSGDLRAKLRQ